MACDFSPVGIQTLGTSATIFRHTSPIFNRVLVQQLLHPDHILRRGGSENSGSALFLAATCKKPPEVLYKAQIVSSVGCFSTTSTEVSAVQLAEPCIQYVLIF